MGLQVQKTLQQVLLQTPQQFPPTSDIHLTPFESQFRQ